MANSCRVSQPLGEPASRAILRAARRSRVSSCPHFGLGSPSHRVGYCCHRRGIHPIEQGLPAAARQDDIVFVARPAAEYLIACGVPGSAALGAYLRLRVSSGARVPTYEFDSASTF